MSSACSDKTNNDNHKDDVDIRYMGKNIQLSSGFVFTCGTDQPNILIIAQTLPIDIKAAMAIAPKDLWHRPTEYPHYRPNTAHRHIEIPTKGRREPMNAKDEL